MKRFTSILLAILLTFGAMASLTACAGSSSKAPKVGDWLTQVEDAFGMYSYKTDEPYVEGMSADDPYFAAAQIAGDWGLLPQDGKLDPNAPLTNELVAATLAKTVGFEDFDGMSDAEIAKWAAENGYLASDYKGGRWGAGSAVSENDAEASIAVAKDIWLNRDYPAMSEIAYAEGVVEIPSGTPVTYNAATNQTIIPSNVNIQPGDVYVLHNMPPYGRTGIFIADSVRSSGGSTLIINSSEAPAFEDVIQKMDINASVPLDFSKAIITDVNGDLLYAPARSTAPMLAFSGAPSVQSLMHASGNPAISSMKTTDFPVSGSISLPGVKGSYYYDFTSAELEVQVDGFKFQLSVTGADYGLHPHYDSARKGHEWDGSRFTVDYDQTLNVSLTETALTRTGKVLYNEAAGQLWDAAKDALKKALKKKGIKFPKLLIPLEEVGFPGEIEISFGLDLDIGGSLSFSTSSHHQIGFDIIDNKPKIINEKNPPSTTLDFQGTIETTLSVTVALTVATIIDLCSLVNERGIGVEGQLSVSFESGEPDFPICCDAKVYAILAGSIYVGPQLLVNIFENIFALTAKPKLNDNIELNFVLSFAGAKLGLTMHLDIGFLSGHYENWHKQDPCTRGDKKGEDDNEDASTTTAPNQAKIDGSQLIVDYGIHLPEGESRQIEVFFWPDGCDGYTLSNLDMRSLDSSVATVDGNGNVRGLKVGETEITVTIKGVAMSAKRIPVKVTAKAPDSFFLGLPLDPADYAYI